MKQSNLWVAILKWISNLKVFNFAHGDVTIVTLYSVVASSTIILISSLYYYNSRYNIKNVQKQKYDGHQGRSFGLNIGAALEILVRQNGVIFGKIGFYCIFMWQFQNIGAAAAVLPHLELRLCYYYYLSS